MGFNHQSIVRLQKYHINSNSTFHTSPKTKITMNSFVLIALVAFAASAQAGFLHAPVAAPIVYHAAPTYYATPVYTAQYPTYAVHSPHIAPVVKTLASPVYSSPVFAYAASPAVKYHSHGYGYGLHK